MSVISCENRFAAFLRSSSRKSLNWRPARAPSVRACGTRPCSSASDAWRTCSRLSSTCWRCVGHPLPVFFALHPFAELVGITQDLLLLLSEPLELSFDFLALGLGLGGLEGRLQFFEPIIHIVLTLRQLAQTIEDLARFTLLSLSLREIFLAGPGRPLVFVPVFLVGELELLELSARLVARRRFDRSGAAGVNA